MPDKEKELEGQEQETDSANDNAAAGGEKADVRTFTQTELDAIIADRLSREREKARKAQEEERKKAEEKELEETRKYQELAEKRAARIAELEAQQRERDLLDVKRDVAETAGLPLKMASRLTGTTREELEADAQYLKGLFPPVTEPDKLKAPNINAESVPPKRPDPGKVTLTQAEREYCDKRGVPYEEYAKYK